MNHMEVKRFTGATLFGVALLLGQSAAEGQKNENRAPVVPASATTTDEVSVKAQIDVIYAQATEATTIAECDAALESCGQWLQQSTSLTHQAYLKQLLAWLHNHRGEIYTQQSQQLTEAGHAVEASASEQRALADFTASINLIPNWRAHHNRGVAYASLGKFQEAIQEFSSALERKPDYINARFNRAEMYLELAQYKTADEDYSSVLGERATDVPALMGRGHARFYLGKFEDALLDFDDAVRHDPENAVALADRADLYAYLGRWEPAARDYRMAIRADSTLGRAFQSAAWMMATCPDDRFRDPLALRAAHRAIELDGQDDYRYLDTLAAALANAGEFEEARNSAEQALSIAPAELAPELKHRLALYRSGRPFRDQAQ